MNAAFNCPKVQSAGRLFQRDRERARGVLKRLRQILRSSNSVLQDVVSVVGLDAELARRILQTANSAFFHHRVRRKTIEEAIAHIGYVEVHRLACHALRVRTKPGKQRS